MEPVRPLSIDMQMQQLPARTHQILTTMTFTVFTCPAAKQHLLLGRTGQSSGRRANGFIVRSVAAGFTLIELMVVLVIIGVLAALIVPNVLDRADDARSTAARTDVNNIMQ